MISFGARIVNALVRAYTYRYRKNHKSLSRSVNIPQGNYKPPKGWSYRIERIDKVKIEVLTPPNCGEGKYILQFHGGSYTACMNNFYRKIAERYARLTHCAVFSIDYASGTELRHPAVLDDCYRACKYLVSKGYRLDDFIAVGDSFGANLMLATCLLLRDDALTLPKALVAVSPAADMSSCGDSYRKNCHCDPMYSLPKHQSFEQYENKLRRISPYCEGSDLKTPLLSPAFAEFDGFPKMLIQCGACEVSESDSDMLYERAKGAKVDVTLTKYAGLFHEFQYIAPFLAESRTAWKEICGFIKASLDNETKGEEGTII